MHLRALTAALLCVSIASACFLPAIAQDDAKPTAVADDLSGVEPSANLELASEQVRLIMGGTAGKGILHFNGKDYPFTFKSASAGLGAKLVTKVSATGNVYALNQIEDFAGKYTSISKSAMVGSSTGTATYKNSKGVTIVLEGKTKGVGLSFGGGIATVELVEP